MANDYTKGVTPVAKAIYPHLNKPDVRFQKEGVYKVTAELSKDDAQELLKQIEEGLATAKIESKSSKTANPPYKIDNSPAPSNRSVYSPNSSSFPN